jgi:predicted translin family RNA/ssDNA-binding protein
MSTSEKWYDRVRTQTIDRIEETLTTLKTLHASEADTQTPDELEEILTQQIATIRDLQTHTQALATSTTTRRNLNTSTPTADQQASYSYRYTAEPDEK